MQLAWLTPLVLPVHTNVLGANVTSVHITTQVTPITTLYIMPTMDSITPAIRLLAT